MKKKRTSKKYFVEVDSRILKDSRKVYFIILDIENKEKGPYGYKEDIEYFASELDLDSMPLDNVYSGYNIKEFVYNSDLDFIVSYLDRAKAVSICIVCKNKKSQKKLEKLINRIRELNEGDYLNPIY